MDTGEVLFFSVNDRPMFATTSLKNYGILPILCLCLWALPLWHDTAWAQKTPESRAISVQPASGSGQRRALLVGVNQYERLKDLKYCEADVSAFKDALIQLGFHPDDIKVLATGGSVKTQPTKNNIEEYLKTVTVGLSENDTVIISLSGHGGQFRSIDGDGKVKSASYFCPLDARPDRPEDTMIPTRTIFQLLEKSPARFKMLLVDACRDKHLLSEDDPGRSSLDESRTVAGFAKSFDTEKMPTGSVAMISCIGGQQSYESPELGQGVFMYHVVLGSLGEADRNGDGIVSLFELRDYVLTQTPIFTYREFNRPQTPRFHAEWEAADYNLFDVSILDAGDETGQTEVSVIEEKPIEKREHTVETQQTSTEKPAVAMPKKIVSLRTSLRNFIDSYSSSSWFQVALIPSLTMVIIALCISCALMVVEPSSDPQKFGYPKEPTQDDAIPGFMCFCIFGFFEAVLLLCISNVSVAVTGVWLTLMICFANVCHFYKGSFLWIYFLIILGVSPLLLVLWYYYPNFCLVIPCFILTLHGILLFASGLVRKRKPILSLLYFIICLLTFAGAIRNSNVIITF